MLGGRGSVPGPAGRAHSALPGPLAGGKGARCLLPKNPTPLPPFGPQAAALRVLLTRSHIPLLSPILPSDATGLYVIKSPRQIFTVSIMRPRLQVYRSTDWTTLRSWFWADFNGRVAVHWTRNIPVQLSLHQLA